MRSFIRKFGVGFAGILVAATMAVTGMGFLSGSADASTDRGTNHYKTSFTFVDQSCNSGASGLIAVNALNCNSINVLNDVLDVVLIGSNSN
jgi:hypothetical protein